MPSLYSRFVRKVSAGYGLFGADRGLGLVKRKVYWMEILRWR
jgi:hypothetical protein